MSLAGGIDIAVVNYRGAHETLAAVAALGRWPHGTVWVVDNSADAAEAERLRLGLAAWPHARLLVAADNLGFGRGCNLAFAQSAADYFFLLNPDARIAAADILAMAATLDADPRIAAASPRIFWNEEHSFLLPCAQPQTLRELLASTLASRLPALARRRAARHLEQTRRQLQGGAPQEVAFLAGAALLLRRSALLRAGGLFDPGYFMFFEDSELSVRLRRAGFRLALLPAASAVHGYRHQQFKAALMAQSRRRYFGQLHPGLGASLRWLDRIDAMARPLAPEPWFDRLGPPLQGAAAFGQAAQGAGVLALSPSLLMVPAMLRNPAARHTGFSDAEWALLEPGGYVALLDGPGTARWVYFEKAGAA